MIGEPLMPPIVLSRSYDFRLIVRMDGAALVVSLIMLVAILLLGIAAAEIALQGAKSSRNDRDRQIAFQAAEAALIDAEKDIEHSSDTEKSRSYIFSPYSKLGFPDESGPFCNQGSDNIYLGLCRRPQSNGEQVWQRVDFSDTNAATTHSVAYGTFTGQVLQSGTGALPIRLPRYVIEQFTYAKAGESAERITYFYRITAVGFGTRETTQVALQSFYRKAGQ